MVQINMGVETAFLACSKRFHQFLTEWIEDHAEATTWALSECEIFHAVLTEVDSPGLSRNADLGETNDVCTFFRSITDDLDGLVDTTLQVIPNRLGLDGCNSGSLAHVAGCTI